MPPSRQPLAEHLSAGNIALQRRPATHRASDTTPECHGADISIYGAAGRNHFAQESEKSHCDQAGIHHNKENTFQQSFPPSTAILCQQISERAHHQDNATLSTKICTLPDHHSSLLSSTSAPQRTPLSSSSSSLPSPFPLISEQFVPPDLFDSNDDLWRKVMSFINPAAGSQTTTKSSIRFMERPLNISSEKMPSSSTMFRWNVDEGKVTESEYKSHWLDSLKPENDCEARRICRLAVSTLEQIRVPPLETDIVAESQKRPTTISWLGFLFKHLFPHGSATARLFDQLGDDDLHQLHLPKDTPALRRPDLAYSLTAEIFPIKYQQALKEKFLDNHAYAAPYLTVFFTKREDKKPAKRMELWGAHMLHARVIEWCHACYPDAVLSKELSSISELVKETVSSTGFHSRTVSAATTTANPRITTRNIRAPSKTESENDKQVEGAPFHYSITLGHNHFSISRFEADLVQRTSGMIELRGITCKQFKQDSALLKDDHWDVLATSLVGIHLANVHHAGVLVRRAAAWIDWEGGLPSGCIADASAESPSPAPPRQADWTSALKEER